MLSGEMALKSECLVPNRTFFNASLPLSQKNLYRVSHLTLLTVETIVNPNLYMRKQTQNGEVSKILVVKA